MTDSTPTPTKTILLYSQDNRGMGHINRTLVIVRHLLAANPDLLAYIVTKSPIASLFALPPRCDYIKLPKRMSLPEHTLDQQEAATVRFREVRSQILRAAALALAPDLVLVDHEPVGSKGEFRDGLYALKERSPATRFVFGLRDIMDDPEQIRRSWRELGVYDALENLYDGIAVYGWRRLYDVAEAYAIPPSVRPKLQYCGFILRDLPVVDPAGIRQEHGLPLNGPLVVATVGGGFDGYPVLAATLDALEQLRPTIPDLAAIVVTGPLMPAEQRAALQARATSSCRILAQADAFQLMAAADAIVSMGGYNSVCEALAAGRPLVIVPRQTHKVEQTIRAEILAGHDLARCIYPKNLSGLSLAEALDWALSCDRVVYALRVRQLIPSFNGAERLISWLSQWISPVPAPLQAAAPAGLERARNLTEAEEIPLEDPGTSPPAIALEPI